MADPTPAGIPQRLWEISVLTSAEAEEATADLVQAVTSAPVSSYHNLLNHRVRVSAHVPRLPLPLPLLRQELQAGLRRMSDSLFASRPVPPRIIIRPLPATNWAESWKKHFPALEIGKALLIRPEWIRRAPRPGQHVVTLDPGLSFGTGHHPTTRFCLRELVKARPRQNPKSMLDIGTGSGLLAIAAAKLGFQPIFAFDSDPVAVRVAQANARRNGVRRRIRIFESNVRDLRCTLRLHDVVCANLQTDLLLEQAPGIAGAVARGGRLVLAGILRAEMPSVLQTYEHHHLQRVHVTAGKEWSSVAFQRP